MPDGGLRFDEPIADGGYRWWYVDGLSDDGREAITLIAFLGAVFSPWYARARRRGPADPLAHCALNVALYGSGRRWTLTERARREIVREPAALQLGSSMLRWRGDCLEAVIDEIAAPLPQPVRGRVRVFPRFLNPQACALDAGGRHQWRPLAPHGRIEVDLDEPCLHWRGNAYLDANQGNAALEADFRGWHWSRAHLPDGSAAVLYDVTGLDGAEHLIAVRFHPDGRSEPFSAPPRTRLPATFWRVARETRADADPPARVVKTLEDTPFYARSLVSSRLFGWSTTALHESLSLDRFSAAWTRLLLPFRMRRSRPD